MTLKRTLFATVRTLFLLGALSAVGACADDLGPSEPRGPGAFVVDVVSPNGAEGSAVFEITGGSELSTVTSSVGEVFYRHDVGSVNVVVILDSPGQLSFSVQTQDLREVPSVTLVQVADGEDQLRSSVAGYDVVVVPVESGGTP